MAKSSKSPHELTKEDLSKGGKKSRRGPALSTLYKMVLDEKVPAKKVEELEKRLGKKLSKKQNSYIIAAALIQKAAEGDVPAIKELNDRTEGKAKQPIELDVSGSISILIDGSEADL